MTLKHLVLILSSALFGCTVLRSTQEEYPTGSDVIAHYYLPRAYVRLKLIEATLTEVDENGSHKKAILLKYWDTVVEPDPSLAYAVRHDRSAFASDQIAITLTKDGLLQNVNVTTEEKTAEILIQLAKGIAGIATPAGVIEEVEVAQLRFDPSDENYQADVRDQLSALMERYPLRLQQADIAKLAVQVIPPTNQLVPAPQSTTKFDGIVYRPVLPYVISITDALETTRHTVLIPNKAPIIAIDVRRTAFVKTVTDLEFSNGLLTKVSITKPSPALAAAAIPLEIAKAIVAVPAELVQIKINENDKEKLYLESEKNRLEAEKALNDLKKQLETEQGL